MTDFVYVCIGGQFVTQLDEEDKHSSTKRWFKIQECVHPTSYRAVPWRADRSKTEHKRGSVDEGRGTLRRNRIVEDGAIVEHAATLDCFDLARTCKDFQQRVYGMKIAFQDYEHKKTIIATVSLTTSQVGHLITQVILLQY